MSRLVSSLVSAAVGGGATYFAINSGYISVAGACKCCGKSPCTCSSSKHSKSTLTDPINAVCILRPDGNSGVSGTVTFRQTNKDEGTQINAQLTGLTPGQHGFHIHQFGDLRQGCKSAKGHYNPFLKNHGGPSDEERHVGDLGNIVADSSGNAAYESTDKLVQLCGPYSILGRSIVVHAGTDDLGKGGFPDSLTTGHAGGRVACGTIGIASE